MEVGSLVSLLQLAVASNVAFTAVLSFRGDGLARERNYAHSLVENAKTLLDRVADDSGNPAAYQDLFSRVVNHRNKATAKSGIGNEIVDLWLRPTCLAFALVSYCILVYASFNTTETYGWFLATIAVTGNVPLLFYMTHLTIRSVNDVVPLKRERVKLDNEISDALMQTL